ncbi:MAG: fibronectin type III domain-containing protein, partial [Aeromicrobium sp.]
MRTRRWLGAIAAVAVAIATVLAAPTAAEAAEVIDVNQPAQGQARFSSQLGQPFTVGVDGTLVAVAFAGTYSSSVPHRVYAADAAGKPTGPVLSSVSARVGTTARLSPPLAVRSGERYVATVTLGSVANALMSTSTTGQAGLQGTSSNQPTWTPLASPFAFSTIVESAPPVPTNVTVALEGGEFVVRWDAAPRATGYEVTWGADPTQYQSTTGTTLRFGAAPRESRTFQVRAFDGSGDAGDWSAGVTLQAGELPFVPTSAVQVLSQRGVEVSWQVPRDNPFGSYQPTYSVWRSDTTAGSAPVQIATRGYIPDGYTLDGLSSFRYVDEGATPGNHYEYQVRSTNAMGQVLGQELPLYYVDTPGAPGLVLEAGARSFSVASLTSSPNGGTISATEYSMRVAGTTAAWSTTPPVKFLQNGTEYQVHARQQNEYGWGPWSDWVSVVPVGAARAPHSLSATPGNGTLALSWSLDGIENGAEIASAQVRYREKGTSTWTEVAAGSPISTTLTGLDPATDIEWQVRAQDVAGRPGDWSSLRTDSPNVAATAPLNLVIEPATEALVVSWTPPADLGGLPVEHYRVLIESPGAEPREVSVTDGTSVTLTALAGALSTVSVWAVTGAGAGTRVIGSAVAYTTPSAPAIDSAAPSQGAVQVAWTAGSDGGSPVLRWEVRVSTASMIKDVLVDDPAARQASIVGLEDGEDVSMTVRAESAAGWGPWSTAFAAMSGVAPTAPVILEIDEADGELIVRWTGSTGSPSPTYTIVASAGSTERVFTADAGAVQQRL